ncbi:MAG TPA: hypothetical protein VF832_16020 [Longimicrobiales bacterium]
MAMDTRDVVQGEDGPGEAEGAATGRARELASRVHELRTTVHRVAELYATRMDGRLAGVERALAGRGHGGRFAAVPRDRVLDRVERELQGLKLKADKGRVKDMARLKELCDTLDELLDGDAG